MKKRKPRPRSEKPRMCDPGMCDCCQYIGEGDFATSIPFLKPVFYDLTVIIFWTPTFSINYIFCKNIINT